MPDYVQPIFVGHNEDRGSPGNRQRGREAAHFLADAENALPPRGGVAGLGGGLLCEEVVFQGNKGPLPQPEVADCLAIPAAEAV